MHSPDSVTAGTRILDLFWIYFGLGQALIMSVSCKTIVFAFNAQGQLYFLQI